MWGREVRSVSRDGGAVIVVSRILKFVNELRNYLDIRKLSCNFAVNLNQHCAVVDLTI